MVTVGSGIEQGRAHIALMPLPLARFSLAVSIALLSPVPSHSRSHSPGDSRSHSRKSDLARSSFTCSSLDLQGTVLRQLEPFLTGITKEALSDHAKELYLERYLSGNSPL